MIDEKLLDLLRCPLGMAPLRLEGNSLVCTRCGPRFAIIDDIPNMLIDEAELPHACPGLSALPCVVAGDATVDPTKPPPKKS